MKKSRKIIFLLSFCFKLAVFLIFEVDLLKEIPFVNSSFHDYEEIEKAIFMKENKMDPYELPTMFHVSLKTL